MKVLRLSHVISKEFHRKELPFLVINDLKSYRDYNPDCFAIPPRRDKLFFVMVRNSVLSSHKFFAFYMNGEQLCWDNYEDSKASA
jgi:hypothetical protein